MNVNEECCPVLVFEAERKENLGKKNTLDLLRSKEKNVCNTKTLIHNREGF